MRLFPPRPNMIAPMNVPFSHTPNVMSFPAGSFLL